MSWWPKVVNQRLKDLGLNFEMTGECDEDIEEIADLIATKLSAIRSRLMDKGFTRIEAMHLLRMYVLADNINANFYKDDV